MYQLSTTYGLTQTFTTLRSAKMWLADRGDALVWERYQDNDGDYWLGYEYGAGDSDAPVGEIRYVA